MDDNITTNQALLMAVVDDLVPSLNGPTTQRFTAALEQLAFEPSRPDPDPWVSSSVERVTASGTVERWVVRLRDLAERGIHLLTVCDDAYPSNLRMIPDHPPLLFVRGQLVHGDERAVAVVGTRTPSTAGARAAYEIARDLGERQVTVMSGLAEGIDTSAHQGAMDGGGRTVAVLGTGIDHVYPAGNRALASAVSRSGACVSQFLPAMRAARWSFPVRNVVTSGLSIGTVVVEAGETSGARRQALAARQHAKRLFLLRALATSQPWAAALAEEPGVVVVDGTDEVMAAIDAELSCETGLF